MIYKKLCNRFKKFFDEKNLRRIEVVIVLLGFVAAVAIGVSQCKIMNNQTRLSEQLSRIDLTPIAGITYDEDTKDFYVSNYGTHPFTLIELDFPLCNVGPNTYCRQILPGQPSTRIGSPEEGCFSQELYRGDFIFFLKNAFGESFIQAGKISRGLEKDKLINVIFLAPIRECKGDECHKECNFR